MELYDWRHINNNYSFLVKQLSQDWQHLLDENKAERFYQSFLAEHAGFFFSDYNKSLVISKLKMGSELECDFVVIKDGYSSGTVYEFIEIEKPSSRLFTKEGILSKDFNTALQQVRDWRRWLIDNKNYFQKFLPTVNTRILAKSQIKFKIIIGRRHEQVDLDKRNQIASENDIEIRSFDSLGDRFNNELAYGYVWNQRENNSGQSLMNKMSSPFLTSIKDSDWKKFCQECRPPSFHFYSNVDDTIEKYLKFNKLFSEYQRLTTQQ